MIVPKAEVKDARDGAGDVRVVGVDNIEQALDALHAAGWRGSAATADDRGAIMRG